MDRSSSAISKHRKRESGSHRLGRSGETIASRYLQAQGYSIVCTNWRYGRLGEVDIVAADLEGKPPVLVFIEVKTRKDARFGLPAEAVSPAKQRRILTLAEVFLSQHPEFAGHAVRFDVIALQADASAGHDARDTVSHLPNAFYGDG